MVEAVRGGGIGATRPVPADAGKAEGGRFVVEQSAVGAGHSSPIASPLGIGLESMLALQAVDEAGERDRRARKRGTDLLAALGRLQQSMLAGEAPGAVLGLLRELTADQPVANDPGLDAIVRAIALRCRVEIARREFGRTAGAAG